LRGPIAVYDGRILVEYQPIRLPRGDHEFEHQEAGESRHEVHGIG